MDLEENSRTAGLPPPPSKSLHYTSLLEQSFKGSVIPETIKLLYVKRLLIAFTRSYQEFPMLNIWHPHRLDLQPAPVICDFRLNEARGVFIGSHLYLSMCPSTATGPSYFYILISCCPHKACSSKEGAFSHPHATSTRQWAAELSGLRSRSQHIAQTVKDSSWPRVSGTPDHVTAVSSDRIYI